MSVPTPPRPSTAAPRAAAGHACVPRPIRVRCVPRAAVLDLVRRLVAEGVGHGG